jgi:hypothetical protein
MRFIGAARLIQYGKGGWPRHGGLSNSSVLGGNDNGKATECKKKRGSKDVRIDDLDGGKLFDLFSPHAQLLADVWKGCSQASSHATNEYSHPAVSDQKELPDALTIILNHLQDTIYNQASKKVSDCVLKSKD